MDTFCGRNVGLRMLVFNDISFMAILAGDHPKRVKVRHSALASENLMNNQP